MRGTMSPRDSLIEGIRLVRLNRAVEAIPFLERAIDDPSLKYAKGVLRVANALSNGVNTIDFLHNGEQFVFSVEYGNLGLDLHHANGTFFEIEELEYSRKITPKRSVIVDVGANTGNHVIFYSRFLDPQILIPFEPVPSAVAALKSNLSHNGVVVDERGLGLAVGSRDGELVMDLGDGSDLVVASVKQGAATDRDLIVKAVTLDNAIPERVDFMKIDVEGFEVDVLSGATRILKEDKPTLMLEMHDNNRERIISYITIFGYSIIREFPAAGYRNVFCRTQ